MDERIAPYAHRIGFETEYRAVLGDIQPRRLQTEHPAWFLHTQSDAVRNDLQHTIFFQYNYKLGNWFDVHQFPHIRKSFSTVLVENRFLYMIGEKAKPSKMVGVFEKFDRNLGLEIQLIYIFV